MPDKPEIPFVEKPNDRLPHQPAITFGQLQKRLSAATERLGGLNKEELHPSVLRLVGTVVTMARKGKDTDSLETIVELAETTLRFIDSRSSDGPASALSDVDCAALERFTT